MCPRCRPATVCDHQAYSMAISRHIGRRQAGCYHGPTAHPKQDASDDRKVTAWHRVGHHPFTGRSSVFWSSTVYAWLTSHQAHEVCPPGIAWKRCACSSRAHTYWKYCNNVMGPPESYSMWNERSQTVPQFKFWSMIIELELLMTRCMRSLWEGVFPLYVQSCDELCG